MVKKLFCFFLVLSPVLLRAQVSPSAELERGIHFDTSGTWQEISARASRENKYIFVDFYATWCGPCKLMDEQVYTNDTVSRVFDRQFVSVRLQADSAEQDKDFVKKRYGLARQLLRQFRIQAYPSLLFFAPNGQLAFEAAGYKDAAQLIELGAKAVDPQSLLFYKRISEVKNGKPDTAYESMGDMALFAEHVLRDHVSAGRIAETYLRAYLDKLPAGELFTERNKPFLNDFKPRITSADSAFWYAYHQPASVDGWLHSPGWAQNLDTQVVNKEELESKLFDNDKPLFSKVAWGPLYENIKKKYPLMDVDRLVLDYQVEYYKRIKDWWNWAEHKNKRLKSYPPSVGYAEWELNTYGAWVAFLNSNDSRVLGISLNWIDSLQRFEKRLGFQELDTKANLLYKLAGRTRPSQRKKRRLLRGWLLQRQLSKRWTRSDDPNMCSMA